MTVVCETAVAVCAANSGIPMHAVGTT